MKKFLKKIALTGLVFLVLFELISRILIEPWYEYALNTYDEKNGKNLKNIYFGAETKHVDYLFIGSSRIPTLIDPVLLKELSHGKVVVNAGRGHMTPGIHYQALALKLKEFPEYLKGAVVFIEYTNSQIYTTPFEQDHLRVYEPVVDWDRPMPQLIIPHLDRESLYEFLKKSKNSRSVKMDVCFLYALSSYRTSEYFNERFNSFNTPLFKSNSNTMVNEGGIRNDNIEELRKKVLSVSEVQKKKIAEAPYLTEEDMEFSSFARLFELITGNGGKLVLFNVPLSTVQRDVYSTEKAQKNREIFEKWLDIKGVQIINVHDFDYTDADFPDLGHLAQNRRAEFTRALYTEIEELTLPVQDKVNEK